MKNKEKFCWYAMLSMKYIMIVLVMGLCVVIGERVGYIRAEEAYEERITQEARNRAIEAMRQNEEDPYTLQLNSESEMLSKVLYGVKDNDSDDLRTYCWCVFNRVDNPAFPGNMADVISQPNQWMRYSEENPVVESLYRIAKEELDKWHTGDRRPVSNDYVFMSWRYDDICLRDSFEENSRTHYWRYS